MGVGMDSNRVGGVKRADVPVERAAVGLIMGEGEEVKMQYSILSTSQKWLQSIQIGEIV